MIVVVLLLVRVVVTVLTLPLGNHVKVIPRLIIAAALTALLLSLFPELRAPPATDELWFSSQVVKEVMLALVISLPTRLFVEGASMVGELIDTARGQTIGAVQDPLNGPAGSDLGVVMRIGALTAAIQFGILDAVVYALYESVRAFPPGSDLFDSISIGGSIAASTISGPLSASFSLALLWIIPFIVIDLFSGVAHRLCSFLQFSSAAAVGKACVTFALLAFVLIDGASAPFDWIHSANPRPFISLLVNDSAQRTAAMR